MSPDDVLRVRARSPWSLMSCLALAGVIALSGCAAAEPAASAPAAQGADSDSDDDVTDSDADADADGAADGDSAQEGATLPDDFPADIPLPQLPLASAERMELDDGMHWVVRYEGDIPESEFTAVVEQLTQRGYVEETSTISSGQLLMARHRNDQYTVDVTLASRKQGPVLQIAVSTDDD